MAKLWLDNRLAVKRATRSTSKELANCVTFIEQINHLLINSLNQRERERDFRTLKHPD